MLNVLVKKLGDNIKTAHDVVSVMWNAPFSHSAFTVR
jgi:hypothetical protein